MSWGGVLTANQVIRLADITDGTTNVMVISESSDYVTSTANGSKVAVDGGAGVGWTSGTICIGVGPAGITGYCGTSTNPTRSGNLTTVLTWLNRRDVPSASSQCGTLNPNRPLISPHTGGVHALFCDGSVRFLGENMNLTTVKRMATRDDGNSLDE